MRGAVVVADPGSFRDPANRVYRAGNRILRGLNSQAAENFLRLQNAAFFRRNLEAGKIIPTSEVSAEADEAARVILAEGWSAVLEHSPLPFVSYPYEWTFAMLQDAALLQLQLQREAAADGWSSRDATPCNIQWRGAAPVFIDAPSFAPEDGGHWHGYRQFAAMFLCPLLIGAHLQIDFRPLLRARLDGIPADEAAKFFRGFSLFKRGVLQHIVFPATVSRAAEKRRPPASAAAKQSPSLRAGLLHNLTATVSALRMPEQKTQWTNYKHSYSEEDFRAKKDFINRVAIARKPDMVWDLGANTGEFAKICAPHAKTVIAADSDSGAVERLYLSEKNKPRNILPLVINLADLSPGQGWRGRERGAFETRGKPDLILLLALLHHLRFGANIPAAMLLDWLRERKCDAVVEFVDRGDEMAQRLLAGRKERFEDYTRANFEAEAARRFAVREILPLKNGMRRLYWLAAVN